MLSANSYNKEFKNCLSIANKFVEVNKKLKLKSFWAVRSEVCLNLFLWHLKEFKKKRDPRPHFIKAFSEGINILITRGKSKLLKYNFPSKKKNNYNFENYIQTLFSDIWQDMTDNIYFNQTYKFTKQRFIKSGVDPFKFFKNKIVVDAGCGSGKFSCAIAKFNAKKVYGFDIGQSGLVFAKKQKKKKEYCKRIVYKNSSILNIPLKKNSVDIVFSNGVIHHTIDYSKCLKEFNRILKKNGELFLYVNGSMGLFEILQDKIREAFNDIPKAFMQFYLKFLGVDSGRLYWLQDCLNAPYEYKTKKQIVKLLQKNGFNIKTQLLRGVKTDQIEQITKGIPFGKIKYGDAQVKFICVKR